MGEILLLVVLFVVGGLLQAAGKRRRQGAEGPTLPPTGLEPSREPGGMLAEIQKALAEMKRANEAATFYSLDEDEVEAVTREVESEVRNLDDVAPRPARVTVVQDDAIEALTAKRAEWAETRSRSHTKADHRAFDAKIRAVEPVLPAGPDRAAALRRMIVWHEVLGKPVALRRPEDG